MFSRIERLLIAIVFALLAAGITLMAVQADDGNLPLTEGELSCATCHAEFQTSWMTGPHAQATEDPAFVEAWNEQGNPSACLSCHVTGYDPETGEWEADGITCQACHGEIPADHPANPMPVDRSPVLCGKCHGDTRFGWQEWELSSHYKKGMECTVCHDPHSASIKQVMSPNGADPVYGDASDLCVNCHNDHSASFPHTTHSEKGVSCVDCHISDLETDERTAHTVPSHAFSASIKSCNTCHAEQMHQPGVVAYPDAPVEGTHISIEEQNIELASVMPEPDSVSPVGFAGLAALIGLAVGMVLAPWLEKFYKSTVEEKNNG
ncbi:MAG: hypothetical protein GY755_00820 [Chloroflexi bacterium]|nr:hypothetical protein [Chloroflexota bacterium]